MKQVREGVRYPIVSEFGARITEVNGLWKWFLMNTVRSLNIGRGAGRIVVGVTAASSKLGPNSHIVAKRGRDGRLPILKIYGSSFNFSITVTDVLSCAVTGAAQAMRELE
jgi:hypothetical protein